MKEFKKPNIEEFFVIFTESILENLPNSVKVMWNIIYPYMSKIKNSIYNIIKINNEWVITFDITKNILNSIIWDFINKQWFIAKNIIKSIMRSNNMDNIDNFIQSVKNWKNNYEKTTNIITKILINTKNKLENEYDIIENEDSIKVKVKNIFL